MPKKNGSDRVAKTNHSFDAVNVDRPRPMKSEGLADLSEEEKPRPYADGASIQCDGSGGWEITYGTWAAATCGTKDCVTAHESSHITDWKAKWPDGCKGQAKGYLPKGDPPDKPLLTAAEYKAFLKDSECRAHTADLNCANALEVTKECEDTVKRYIKLTKEQKSKWCE